MSISYTLLPEDLFVFYKQRLQSTAWAWKFCMVLLVVSVPALLFLDDYRNHRDMLFSTVFALVSLSVLSVVAWAGWLMLKQLMKRRIRQQGQNNFCVHTLTLANEEIVNATDHSQARVLWSAIHKIDELTGHILIYTSPGAAFVIPKRAFTTPNQMREFYRMALTLQTTAKTEVHKQNSAN